ncbi:MAG: hypothetical protein OEY50_04745 [Nitrospinota bacterium]|nr:hypothetical protein [Nitrospinota bacterium]MDH5677082.1 hypothetical protein [Nitrospinota bacterium]MDH5755276.1 hypothetical protein [Nitrospinota bacterium]
MTYSALFVGSVAAVVAALGAAALGAGWSVGPVVLLLAALPVAGLALARRPITSAVPDMVFGSIDTGLLVIPAVLGGAAFGVAGAVAGSVIGDAITDSIAGFFEGGIAQWLRNIGIEESREAVTTALGKMAGCLAGGGGAMTLAGFMGVRLSIG